MNNISYIFVDPAVMCKFIYTICFNSPKVNILEIFTASEVNIYRFLQINRPCLKINTDVYLYFINICKYTQSLLEITYWLDSSLFQYNNKSYNSIESISSNDYTLFLFVCSWFSKQNNIKAWTKFIIVMCSDNRTT